MTIYSDKKKRLQVSRKTPMRGTQSKLMHPDSSLTEVLIAREIYRQVSYIDFALFYGDPAHRLTFVWKYDEDEDSVDLSLIKKDVAANVHRQIGTPYNLNFFDISIPVSYVYQGLTPEDRRLSRQEIEDGLAFTPQEYFWSILEEITKRIKKCIASKLDNIA